MFSLLNDSDEPTTQVDKNVYELLFTPFNQRDTDGLKDHLDRSDGLDVFRILQEVNRELTSVKLENIILIDFLQRNDPKLLIGLDQVGPRTLENRRSIVERRKSRMGSAISLPSLTRTESRTMSIGESTVCSFRKVSTDYRINYRTKVEIAEKLTSEIHKNCEVLEAKGKHEIKILNGQIEELRYRCADNEETSNIFKLYFFNNNTLDGASEKQMEKHMRKFVNNWLMNGRALQGTMRLKITSLQEQCHQQRTALITKVDLSGMLGPVDFEQLQIKRDEQSKSLDEKNVSLAGLKEVSGKASLSLTNEKKLVLAIEQTSKILSARTDEVVKGISKLEQETKAVEKEISLAEETLQNLKIQIEGFEAPSVTDYIRRKEELIELEREEKLLERKSYIQQIKMKNASMKLRIKNGRR